MNPSFLVVKSLADFLSIHISILACYRIKEEITVTIKTRARLLSKSCKPLISISLTKKMYALDICLQNSIRKILFNPMSIKGKNMLFEIVILMYCSIKYFLHSAMEYKEKAA